MESHLRLGRKCVFLLHVHLVFVTRYRKAAFRKKHYDTMREIFEGVCEDFDAELTEFDGEADHVHLLVNYPTKASVSKMVNSLKGAFSRVLRNRHPELHKYFWGRALWSPSYFAASCGGAPLAIVRKYIEQQASPDG
jgi:putative transposase